MKINPWITAILAAYLGCAACNGEGTSSSANTTEPPLPPVQVNLSRGIYSLPGCPHYDKIRARYLLILSTAREAALNGFQPDRLCGAEIIATRLDRERQLFGELPSTPTKRRRIPAPED